MDQYSYIVLWLVCQVSFGIVTKITTQFVGFLVINVYLFISLLLWILTFLMAVFCSYALLASCHAGIKRSLHIHVTLLLSCHYTVHYFCIALNSLNALLLTCLLSVELPATVCRLRAVKDSKSFWSFCGMHYLHGTLKQE